MYKMQYILYEFGSCPCARIALPLPTSSSLFSSASSSSSSSSFLLPPLLSPAPVHSYYVPLPHPPDSAILFILLPPLRFTFL